MPDRRGSRFLLEALFLAGLAAALAVARLRAVEIAGAMLAGWLLVAVLEWAAWRGRPHYGSGLPPRYYVPRLNLPPAPPAQGARAAGAQAPGRGAEPTWIAQPAMRTAVIGDWPLAVAGPVPAGPVPSDPVPGTVETRPAPQESDPWLVVSLPVAPIERQAAPARPTPASQPPPAEPEVATASWSTVVAARSAQGSKAFHLLDPLAEEPRRKRRGGGEEPLRVEVPERPPGVRRLPRRWNEGAPA